MATRGSKLTRALTFFREADIDEVLYVFDRAGEIIRKRLGESKPKPQRRTRKAKGANASDSSAVRTFAPSQAVHDGGE